MFGLHSNAEIGYLTNLGESLCFTILQCSGSSGGGGGSKKDELVNELIIKFLEKLPLEYNMVELRAKAKERTPFVVVCLQECERMNTLIFTIRSSLEDLDAGMKGQLNITENMEKLADSMFVNVVPDLWAKYAYASRKDLLTWYDDLLARCLQLDEYSEELIAPISLWISGLFNPMSYLTAIMQVTARNEGLALDNMMLKTTVLNIEKSKDCPERPENGAFIHGFFLQGAKWELGRGQDQGNLMDMIPKELYPELPVVHITAIEKSKQIKIGFYNCPVYTTTARGATYVFTAGLKMESEEPDAELYWILAGVALFMQPE